MDNTENPNIRFARASVPSDKAELRVLMPYALLQMIDAYALAKDLSRAAYVEMILEKHVRLKAHERSIEQRMTRDNPYAVVPERRVL